MLKAIGSRKNLKQQLYYEFVADLLESKSVQDLKQYRHHIKTTRFQHSLNVSYYNYLICKFFHWDAVSAARAGLLHDLYFYETADYDATETHESHSAHHQCNAAVLGECCGKRHHTKPHVAGNAPHAALQRKLRDCCRR